MQLGEILVRTGVIDAEKLDAALRQQVVYGARLGTNLIELGYAEQDDIARALAKKHGVAGALARHLSQHDNAVLDLLPKTLAARFSAFPIAYSMSSGRRLVVCMRDPIMPEAIAEMSQYAKLGVVACVAPELAVFYWLERCYKIPRARRYAYAEPGKTSPLPGSPSETIPTVSSRDFEDEDIDVDFDEEPDMADMLQLVDLDHSQVARDHSQYQVETKHQGSSLDMAARRATDTSPQPRYTLRDPTPQSTQATAGATAVGGAQTRATNEPPLSFPATVMPSPPAKAAPKMTMGEACDAIDNAEKRDEVMTAVEAYMRGVFGAGLVLIIKDELALGLRGFGGNFDDSSVETIVLPLSAQSFFETTYQSRELFHGEPDEGHLQARFFKLFADGAPAQVVLVPVVLRDRVVCMFYAHAKNGLAIKDRLVAELAKLAHKTQEAFVRLIRGGKKAKND